MQVMGFQGVGAHRRLD